jgi:hypothetical protein
MAQLRGRQIMLVILVNDCLERTCHQELGVGSLAVFNYKVFSLLLDFIPDLFN